MNLPDIGTIVRLQEWGELLAVVVPIEHGPRCNWDLGGLAFTRLLQGPRGNYFASHPNSNGGWYVGNVEAGDYEIVPDDEVPDEILGLAMRCLLDPTFIPEFED